MPEKGKRVFCVCRSKNCSEAKQSGVRCTVSMPEKLVHFGNQKWAADELNERKLCLFYSHSLLGDISQKPFWVVSPEKPGRKAIAKAEQERVAEQMTQNPDFLEI